MKKTNLVVTVSIILIAVIVLVVVLLVRNNSSSNTLSNSQKISYTNQINANWSSFFATATSLSARENLLQNGSKFSQPIQTEFNIFSNEGSSASVSSIKFLNKTTADVTYTVFLAGQPVLKDEAGQALFIDNTWKVSDSTLCTLLTLGGTKTSACPTKS